MLTLLLPIVFSVFFSKDVEILGRCFSFSISLDENLFVGYSFALLYSERSSCFLCDILQFVYIIIPFLYCLSNIWTDWVNMTCYFSNFRLYVVNIWSDQVNMAWIVFFKVIYWNKLWLWCGNSMGFVFLMGPDIGC